MLDLVSCLPVTMSATDGGTKQRWDAQNYDDSARFVSDHGIPVITEWLRPQQGESVLDLGCGDGALTIMLQNEFGCHAVGIDSSRELVDAAKRKGLKNAEVADAHNLTYDGEFDAVFSNAALHWMKDDPERIAEGVWRALKPGGRFVGEFGGAGNIATIEAAIQRALKERGICRSSPWYFPSPREYRNLLERAGFEVVDVTTFDRPTPIPGQDGIKDWLQTFANIYLDAVGEANGEDLTTKEFIDKIRKDIRLKLFDEHEGVWMADYVRLRFKALKKCVN